MRTEMACFGVRRAAVLSLILAIGWPVLAVADETRPTKPSTPADSSTGDVQERGVAPSLLEFKKDLQRKPSVPVPANPPPQLCRTETHMMTQCKCFSLAECQALTALFPNSCPAASAHCEFVPMSRGPMPALPPNLCSYQVPFPVTRCSCHTQAECQLLSPFCPGTCPPGSQSCECTPLQKR